MTDTASARGHCPQCGAELRLGSQRCWLCDRRLAERADTNPYASPRPTENVEWQFSLASLFLVMTLVAVCVGIFVWSPGLGVLLAVLAAPALIRTTIDAAQYKQRGSRLSPAGKIGAFLLSVCVVVAVGMASCVAGATVCTAGVALASAGGASDSNIFVVVISIGACAALGSAAGLFWLTRPRA